MKERGYAIAVAGKGGTGKTFFSAVLVDYFTRYGNVLAIDADPDSNLPEALGVQVKMSIGDAREQILEGKHDTAISSLLNKQQALEMKIMELIAEEEKFDLVVMGRSEGEGCYCAVNTVLRQVLDAQVQNYDTTVIDCEAGLEHLSRRTTRDVDLMVIVTDGSKKGFATAKRIVELSKELRVQFGKLVVVANKIMPNIRNQFDLLTQGLDLEIAGFIPFDSNVTQNDLEGNAIMNLPTSSEALRAAMEICKTIQQIRDGKG